MIPAYPATDVPAAIVAWSEPGTATEMLTKANLEPALLNLECKDIGWSG
jgi:hypothetical protein